MQRADGEPVVVAIDGPHRVVDPPPCILLVEDEALVRMVAMDGLVDMGFEVAEAGSAAEAVDLLRALGARIAAVVLDLGLPDRPGERLAVEMRTLRPELPIIVASGFRAGEEHADLAADTRIRFVEKPYTDAALAAALRALGVRPPRRPA